MATAQKKTKRNIIPVGPQNASKRALAAFEERFAKDMGVKPILAPHTSYKTVSTGTLALDARIGTGGWPVGRIVELWGPEHAGKTTQAMMAVAEFQAAYPNRYAAWIDMEHTFDSTWAETLGVDLNRLYLHQPLTAEDVGDSTRRFLETGFMSLVVIDSVGSMIAKAEYEKEADESTVGLVAKIVTRMVKQSAPVCYRNETTVLVINQVRAIIGSAHGPSEDTGGGWALKHVSSLKIQVRRGERVVATIGGEETEIGHKVVNRIQKNKINGRKGKAEFVLISQPHGKYDTPGLDKVAETFDIAKDVGVLPGGAWVVLPGDVRINGREKAIAHLREHPEAVAALRKQVIDAVRHGHADLPEEDEDGTGQFTDEDMEVAQ